MKQIKSIPRAVAELTDDGMSQREVGEVLGVNAATVNRDVANATAVDAEEPEINTLEQDSVANASPIDTVAALAADEKIKAATKAVDSASKN